MTCSTSWQDKGDESKGWLRGRMRWNGILNVGTADPAMILGVASLSQTDLPPRECPHR